MNKYEETWDLTESDLFSLFPSEKIGKLINKDLTFSVLFDDEILAMDITNYNISIFTRAYNQDIPDEKLCRKNLFNVYDLIEDSSLRDVVNIKLPQAIIFDNLGYNEKVMSLHFTKLRSDEFYINDFVMKNNPEELLKKGLQEK